MTTKELIDRLYELDFVGEILEDTEFIEVFDLFDNRIGFVDKEIMHQMSTLFLSFSKLEKFERQLLFGVLLEYAKTPIKDREEKTLYTAISKIDPTRSLCRVDEDGYRIRIIGFDVPDEITTEFTEEELKNVKGINVLDSNEWLVDKV